MSVWYDEIYEVRLYTTSAGKCPFDEWLEHLDAHARVAIVQRLERVELGNFGQCKALGNKIFELKIDLGHDYCVFFAKIGLQIVLLLCAGNKGSQRKDIARAENYLNDWTKRKLSLMKKLE